VNPRAKIKSPLTEAATTSTESPERLKKQPEATRQNCRGGRVLNTTKPIFANEQKLNCWPRRGRIIILISQWMRESEISPSNL
jgi:hypothetical protein